MEQPSSSFALYDALCAHNSVRQSVRLSHAEMVQDYLEPFRRVTDEHANSFTEQFSDHSGFLGPKCIIVCSRVHPERGRQKWGSIIRCGKQEFQLLRGKNSQTV